MDMDGVKIYGLCLERLKHQIALAKAKIAAEPAQEGKKNVLECYRTGDPAEIVDILELYDVTEETIAGVTEKLEELAFTVSILSKETIEFGFSESGELCLYWVTQSQR